MKGSIKSPKSAAALTLYYIYIYSAAKVPTSAAAYTSAKSHTSHYMIYNIIIVLCDISTCVWIYIYLYDDKLITCRIYIYIYM